MSPLTKKILYEILQFNAMIGPFWKPSLKPRAPFTLDHSESGWNQFVCKTLNPLLIPFSQNFAAVTFHFKTLFDRSTFWGRHLQRLICLCMVRDWQQCVGTCTLYMHTNGWSCTCTSVKVPFIGKYAATFQRWQDLQVWWDFEEIQ